MNIWCVHCVFMKNPPKMPVAHIVMDGKSMCWNHFTEMYLSRRHKEKENEEIRKYDAETSERLQQKSELVTNNSIRFTNEEYDKLKTAFCKGNGWDLEYPHTVTVHSIILKGNYKWMPLSQVEFDIDVQH